MIQGAIFDVDGTLLDSMPIWEHLGERYLASFGKSAAPGLTDILNTMSTRQGTAYLIQQYGLGISEEEAMAGVSRLLYDFYSGQVLLKEGVEECLEMLNEQKIPMIIATSGDREVVEAALKRLDISRYFQDILTCSEMLTDKTKPDIFLAAAVRIGTRPADTIVFEDVLHAVRTAKAAGFVTAALYDRSSAGQETEIRDHADYYFKTMGEFKL